jgi:hypothetical protein
MRSVALPLAGPTRSAVRSTLSRKLQMLVRFEISGWFDSHDLLRHAGTERLGKRNAVAIAVLDHDYVDIGATHGFADVDAGVFEIPDLLLEATNGRSQTLRRRVAEVGKPVASHRVQISTRRLRALAWSRRHTPTSDPSRDTGNRIADRHG